MHLAFPGRTLSLDPPVVMGVLNVTPDSFSDGGEFLSLPAAVARARELAAEGAAIIDVGGESTRPGAEPVDAAEEARRVVPVIERVAAELGLPVSVDSSKPAVMAAAVEAGAVMVNDVAGLAAPGALETAAGLGVAVCVMHMRGEPRTMQADPVYEDVVREVRDYLARRVDACLGAGIGEDRIVIDPGFGFGKNLAHNLELMRRLEEFTAAGLPLLVGVSRKSMIGAVLDRPVTGRLWGGLALAALAVARGAAIVRAHDVAPTLDVLRMVRAVESGPGPEERDSG